MQPGHHATEFVNKLIADRKNVYVYLINGIKLAGRIETNDDASIVLIRKGESQLIHKHAIATIQLKTESNRERETEFRPSGRDRL